jgi:activator of 2-hydroxyglutaryl-CoA dehydratase/predicted nucleotide-binding protein (sugar kinase/HSP70/actin superfamily)
VATVRTPPPRVLRVAGCDLGKASASFAIGEVDAQGVLQLHSSDTVMHGGKPLEVFSEWYRREGVASCVALGVTGVHADRVGAPAVTGLPEDACLQAALGQPGVPKGSLNAISIGARGYAVLSRNRDGRFQYLENDKCSSGTGETMVKVAARFGLTLAEADRLASAAQELIPITARCSVFAKSEMTHFANQGRPTDALFRGYFGSIATYVTALLARVKVDGPVLVLGGGARIEALVTALRELLGDALVLPDDPQQFEARGALFLAAEQARAEALPPLPPDPTALAHRKETRIVTLEPASSWSHQVRRLAAPSVDPKAASRPSVLGIDLGSTGSKAALVSLSDGQMVLDAYDRTRGNPVDATRRLIEALLSQAAPDVRAVGLTGSGREAAATVLRATWPHLEDRIVVLNEIVAHGTAAIRLDEDDGESLSVVEIGGQDAKFIQIVGGQIVESDLNKACSAGTGSFLEEQAVFYGVHDIEEFTELAQRATRPPELGQMCTVFVADAATAAHGEGYGIPDLFGGFQYSVIHNYMHRVMGQRTFGKRIFFQGKPATGPSLPWTLAAVTGREVVVPPNPGAMGAWGIGLCTLEALGAEVLEDAPPIDLSAVVDAEVVGRSEFQCRDRRCATLCAIERTVVAVGDKRETVLSGGACPKYEISTAVRPRLPKEAPSAFAERDALLAPFLEHLRGEQVVGVPLVGACTGVLPWLVTFVHELGFGVRVLRPDAGALSRGEERCYSYDACAPAKIAHGVVDAEVERVFFPKLLSLGDRDGSGGSTCPMEQALPEMIRESLRDRGSRTQVVHPPLSLDAGMGSPRLLRQLFRAARTLGAARERVPVAAYRAARAQRRYERELAAVGRRTLAYGSEHGVPVVAVLGSLHVLHDRGVNASVPHILRDNGVLALPMDCYPIPNSVHPMPRAVWAEANRVLRTAAAARERGDVYPLLLTAFGCGPSSFVEQVFTRLMAGYPPPAHSPARTHPAGVAAPGGATPRTTDRRGTRCENRDLQRRRPTVTGDGGGVSRPWLRRGGKRPDRRPHPRHRPPRLLGQGVSPLPADLGRLPPPPGGEPDKGAHHAGAGAGRAHVPQLHVHREGPGVPGAPGGGTRGDGPPTVPGARPRLVLPVATVGRRGHLGPAVPALVLPPTARTGGRRGGPDVSPVLRPAGGPTGTPGASRSPPGPRCRTGPPETARPGGPGLPCLRRSGGGFSAQRPPYGVAERRHLPAGGRVRE